MGALDLGGGLSESFAVYLAKHYCAKKGFSPGTVEEAAELVSAEDLVLSRFDGLRFEIVLIIDRETHPARRFTLAREMVERIGESCLKYSGTIRRIQQPVFINIIEVGPAIITDSDRDRLKSLKRRSLGAKVVPSGWLVDTAAATVWTSAPFSGRWSGRSFVEKVLRSPRLSDAELRDATPALPTPVFPYLTWSLIAVLAAAFGAELLWALEPLTALLSPGTRTLVALGALNKPLVLAGEWYRMLTATVLHGNVLHLVMNGIALYFAGRVLETQVGRAWFLALYVCGALGGSALSLALNPSTMVSVGASGAIMGLMAAALTCSFRLPPGALRTLIQTNLLPILIPSLIPLGAGGTGPRIDFAAHLGGAITGLAFGFGLLKSWRPREALPRFRRAAAAFSAAAVGALALAFLWIAHDYRAQAMGLQMVPAPEMPTSEAEGKARSAELVARYPHDPRIRLLRAAALLDAKDAAGAAAELRAGLADEAVLRSNFTPDLEAHLRSLLVAVLLDSGRAADARTEARPICGHPPSPQIRKMLEEQRLCD